MLALCSYWRDVALFGVSVSLSSPEREQRGLGPAKLLPVWSHPSAPAHMGKVPGAQACYIPMGMSARKLLLFVCKEKEMESRARKEKYSPEKEKSPACPRAEEE